MRKNGGEKTVRFSLRTKNMLLFVGLFVLLIAALWLINRFGLPSYYLKQQLQHLEEVREELVKLASDSTNEDLQLKLNLECERYGIEAILVASGDAGTILFSAGEGPAGRWLDLGLEQEMHHPVDKIYAKEEEYATIETRDPMTRSQKIMCLGHVDRAESERCYYLLALSLTRIQESVQLSNRFLLLIGLGILVIGSCLILLFTKQMTDPIITLSRLSRKMASLDFSERFEGHSGDEIQQLGENINHLSDNLESTIGNLQKANQHLEQDVREKERQNEQRKELLANISHELKTPIALIQGYAEGLRDGMCEDDELRVRYSDIIMDEAARMNRLVRVLLSLDELESGVAQIEKTRFDLAGLIRDISASYEMKSEQAGIRVEMDLPDELLVESDALLAEQIVQNYISNAFHYVREGGVIRITAKPQGETGVFLSVYNEGERIPEEALPQVWNKFYKVDKARTRSYGGSGIGLSLVKASAARLGGGCDVKNTEEGVEFTAWF